MDIIMEKIITIPENWDDADAIITPESWDDAEIILDPVPTKIVDPEYIKHHYMAPVLNRVVVLIKPIGN